MRRILHPDNTNTTAVNIKRPPTAAQAGGYSTSTAKGPSDIGKGRNPFR